MSVQFLPAVSVDHRPDRVLLQAGEVLDRELGRAVAALTWIAPWSACFMASAFSITSTATLSASIRNSERPRGRHAPLPAVGTSRHASVSPPAQRLELRLAEGQHLGHGPVLAPQRHRAGVARQAVEVGAVEAGEAFEPVERAGGVEGLGVELERVQRGVAAGAAAGVLLQRRGVRRAVGAEEEARAAARSPPPPARAGAPRASAPAGSSSAAACRRRRGRCGCRAGGAR